MAIRIFFCTVLALILGMTSVQGQQSEQFGLKTVVIDPGHGGTDAGAVYGKYYEKNIVLSVALKLGDMIKSKFPNIKVVYTRDKDYFVKLDQRARIANDAKGDLFISIHVNSVKGAPSARGVETFTVGMHKNAANLEVAMKENSVMELEKGYEQTYEGFDPNNEESYIIFSLGQQAYQRQSLTMSYEVQEALKSTLSVKDRGMKQAGFWILWATSMPSILAELGFISNATDRQYLCNDAGQKKMASALFSAFEKYKNSIEVVSSYQSDKIPTETAPKETEEPKETEPEVVTTKANRNVHYSVQILVSNKNLETSDSKFRCIDGKVFRMKSKKLFKYFAGKEKSYKEVLSLQNYLKNNGFKDAFIVAFNGDKLISVSEAQELLATNSKN